MLCACGCFGYTGTIFSNTQENGVSLDYRSLSCSLRLLLILSSYCAGSLVSSLSRLILSGETYGSPGPVLVLMSAVITKFNWSWRCGCTT